MTKLINHVIFCVDESGSMHHLTRAVNRVFEETLTTLKSISGADQETRISLYTFNSFVHRRYFDKHISDVPQTYFNAGGTTALRSAARNAVYDHRDAFNTTEKEDHTFLLYVITDGQDNSSDISPPSLANLFTAIGDRWTVVALVPSAADAHFAHMSGFPHGNIQVWDATSEKGVEDVGRTIQASYNTYSNLRMAGATNISTIFQTNLAGVTAATAKNQGLKEVSGSLYHAQKDYVIKDMVEKFTGKSYVKGSAFYELTKTELLQGYKEIVIIRNNKEGKRYGGDAARTLLGIGGNDMKIKPGDHADWRIFVQSTSLNRKVLAGTSIFVKE